MRKITQIVFKLFKLLTFFVGAYAALIIIVSLLYNNGIKVKDSEEEDEDDDLDEFDDESLD